MRIFTDSTRWALAALLAAGAFFTLESLSSEVSAQESGAGTVISVDVPVGGRVYTEGLHGVDLSGLSDQERTLALKVLNQADCTCSCGMNVAQCRVEDQSCPRSPALARAIVDAVRRGQNEDGVWQAYHSAAGRSRAGRGAGLGESAILGNPAAPVTIIEFSDFRCSPCARASRIVGEVVAAYPDQVKVVYKHLPLAPHPQADLPARAAEAALEQGKFWEMHDLMFENVENLERGNLMALATELGLDMARFELAIDSPETISKVKKDVEEAQNLGATGTPTFFVNGRRLLNYQFETFRNAIDAALASPSTPGR